MKMLQAKMDDQLVNEAEEILKDLGLNRSTALKIYQQQIVLNKGLPFEVKLPYEPNEETIAALKEDLSDSKAYSSSDELWKATNKFKRDSKLCRSLPSSIDSVTGVCYI